MDAPVADTRHRRDGTCPDHLSQRRDLDRKVAFLNVEIGPDVFQQFRLGHHPAGMRIKIGQYVEGSGADLPGFAVDPHRTLGGQNDDRLRWVAGHSGTPAARSASSTS